MYLNDWYFLPLGTAYKNCFQDSYLAHLQHSSFFKSWKQHGKMLILCWKKFHSRLCFVHFIRYSVFSLICPFIFVLRGWARPCLPFPCIITFDSKHCQHNLEEFLLMPNILYIFILSSGQGTDCTVRRPSYDEFKKLVMLQLRESIKNKSVYKSYRRLSSANYDHKIGRLVPFLTKYWRLVTTWSS